MDRALIVLLLAASLGGMALGVRLMGRQRPRESDILGLVIFVPSFLTFVLTMLTPGR